MDSIDNFLFISLFFSYHKAQATDYDQYFLGDLDVYSVESPEIFIGTV